MHFLRKHQTKVGRSPHKIATNRIRIKVMCLSDEAHRRFGRSDMLQMKQWVLPFFQGVEVMGLRKVLGVLLVLMLGVVTTAGAQTTTTGRIIGTLSDQQGAVVPGATVTATSPQLQ